MPSKMPKKYNQPTYVFNSLGKLIFRFKSLADASRVLGIKNTSICYSIKNKSLYKKMFYFKYFLGGKKTKEIQQQNINFKAVYMFDSEFNIITKFHSVRQAAIKLKIPEDSVYSKIRAEHLDKINKYFLSYNPFFYKKKISHKKVFVFNTEWELISKYNSVFEAYKDLKITTPSLIYKCIQTNRICNGRYYFSYNALNFIPKYKIITTTSGKNIKAPKPSISEKRIIYQFDRYGKLEQEYFTIEEASIDLKISPKVIRKSLNNKTICNYKYIFSREPIIETIKTNVPIYLFDRNGKFIFEFENIYWCMNILGTNYADTYNAIVSGKILRQKKYLRIEKEFYLTK